MAKIETIITDHLDVWSSAIKQRNSQGRGSSKKQELYGIQKLRELILELAVRGLLVPQDPKDEPASVLLEKITAERADLVKLKQVKKQKNLTSVDDNEPTYNLPTSWLWTRLGSITEIGPRNNNVADDTKVSFIPMPLISTSHKGEHGQEDRLWSEIKKGYTHFANGDIGLAKITPCFENSKAAVFKDLTGGIGAGTTELHIARPFSKDLEPLYVLLYLKSPIFLNVGKTQMTGSAGQKRVPTSFFAENPFPLPPANEQKRIVAKVDELMALCDQLEERQENSITAQQQLVEVLLTALTQAADAEAFQQAWTRLAANFETLFTTENSIDQLKQTLLQLAVMGKLVPQDSSDEIAKDLLMASIKAKNDLIQSGKLKLSKSKKIIKEESFFSYPESWVLAKLEDLMRVINGRAYKKSEMLSEGTPILRVGNLFTSNEWYYSDLELEEDKYINNGDLIYAWSASFGPFIWNGQKAIYHYHIWKMGIYSETSLDKYFSKLYLQAISERIKASGNGIAMMHMTKERMEKIIHPLPPLTEQKRIVAKVDQLFAICDQLKAKIRTAQTTQLQLADALTSQAVQ